MVIALFSNFTCLPFHLHTCHCIHRTYSPQYLKDNKLDPNTHIYLFLKVEEYSGINYSDREARSLSFGLQVLRGGLVE